MTLGTRHSTHNHKEPEHQLETKSGKTHNTMAIQEMERLGKTTVNPGNPPCQ